jgi:hypothetical protein
LGIAVPRRGALSIAAGVKSEAASTNRMLERKSRAIVIVGDFVNDTILTIDFK